jgi:mitogen-activated protein kinase 1/3
LLGLPNEEDLGFLRSDNAKKYVKQLQHVDKQPFAQRFPDISPLAIDLAEKMLVFDPSKRITGMCLYVKYPSLSFSRSLPCNFDFIL